MSGDNQSIGRFNLDGLLPAPRGVPQIEVTFDIDANGILSVSARDKGTGKEQKIVIQPSSGLNDGDVDKMVAEAEQYAEEDKRKRSDIEVRNQADTMLYSTEKLINEHQDKVPEELKQEVEGKLAGLREAIQKSDIAMMQAAMADLNGSLQNLGQAVYGQAGAATDTETEESQGDGQDGTVEGEFREV
jgi:molecular chaperone DnaK